MYLANLVKGDESSMHLMQSSKCFFFLIIIIIIIIIIIKRINAVFQ